MVCLPEQGSIMALHQSDERPRVRCPLGATAVSRLGQSSQLAFEKAVG